MLHNLYPFIISLIIGLLIGIERERSHPPALTTLGVRSFMLFALLGTIAAWINQIAITVVLSLFASSIILFSYFRTTRQKHNHIDIGITTEIAAAVVYCLGYIAIQNPQLATILGAVVLLTLFARQRLHQFSRNQLTREEIQAAVILILIALIVFPFLPNHTIDPWGIFNPRKFGVLVLMIAGIQFGGYVAIQVFGHRLGMLLSGFFGGLVSSTALFVTLPQTVREHPMLWRSGVAAAIFSTIAMLLEFSIIIFAVLPNLLLSVMWSVLVMIGVGLLAAFLISRTETLHRLPPPPRSPLHILSVLRLSALLTGMLFLVALAQHYIGNEGLHIVAFLGGLFELHSITLATSLLYAEGKIPIANADLTLALAILASFIAKFILLLILARNRFGIVTAGFLLAMLLAGTATFLWIHY